MTIIDSFSEHAKMRFDRRFKDCTVSQIEEDMGNAKFGICCQTGRNILVGKIARYVISDSGVVVTMLPIKPKAKNKQIKPKNFKPRQKLNTSF